MCKKDAILPWPHFGAVAPATTTVARTTVVVGCVGFAGIRLEPTDWVDEQFSISLARAGANNQKSKQKDKRKIRPSAALEAIQF